MSRVVIFANGDLHDIEYAKSHLRIDDFIVAANGGTRLAWELARIPDIIIGDSDSLGLYLKEWVQKHRVPRETYPAAKDETDLELAVRYALSRYPHEILLIGLTGSRADHMLANFSLLSVIASYGISAEVIVNRQHIYSVTSSFMLEGTIGDTVSILPWGGDASGVRTEGLIWELQNETLPFGPARGISNVMSSEKAIIGVSKGLLLVIHQRGTVE